MTRLCLGDQFKQIVKQIVKQIAKQIAKQIVKQIETVSHSNQNDSY